MLLSRAARPPLTPAAACLPARLQDPGGSVAFSWAMNAILMAEAGDTAAAARFATQCHEAFVHGPFRVWSEGAGGWGVANFVTGAAGMVYLPPPIVEQARHPPLHAPPASRLP